MKERKVFLVCEKNSFQHSLLHNQNIAMVNMFRGLLIEVLRVI
jgi:hypothetical protein